MDRYVQSYTSEMEAFIHAVLNNRDGPVAGMDGLISVAFGLAARKPARRTVR